MAGSATFAQTLAQAFGQLVNMSATTYHFHWIDYAVFAVMLVASAGSGIYYGYCR